MVLLLVPVGGMPPQKKKSGSVDVDRLLVTKCHRYHLRNLTIEEEADRGI